MCDSEEGKAVRLEIEPRAINEFLAEIVLKSTLGAKIQEYVDKLLADKSEMNRMIEYAISRAVESIAKDHINSELEGPVRALVDEAFEEKRAELKQAVVESLVSRVKRL